MQYTYYTADVFTRRLYSGAQIAVLPEAEGLDDTTMQAIAGELNLSETVFIFAAGDDGARRIRIFNRRGEVDFAVHPIIAAAQVLAATGALVVNGNHRELRLIQNAGATRVDITASGSEPDSIRFALEVRPVIDRFVPPLDQIAEILSLGPADLASRQYQPLIVYTGQSYLIVPCANHAVVRGAHFNYVAWSRSSAPASMANEILMFSARSELAGSNFHARLVGPAIGVDEDPPVGTAMPAFAAYLCAHEHIRHGTHTFVVDRGSAEDRQSVLNIEMDHRGEAALTVRIGGTAVMVCAGRINVPD